jgi:hypothetical protein
VRSNPAGVSGGRWKKIYFSVAHSLGHYIQSPKMGSNEAKINTECLEACRSRGRIPPGNRAVKKCMTSPAAGSSGTVSACHRGDWCYGS